MSEDNSINFKQDWLKWINTFLLSVLSVIGALLISNFQSMNDKLDAVLIQQAVNNERITSHNVEADMWKDRITALESENKDHITRSEVIEAIENTRDWVEKYYQKR